MEYFGIMAFILAMVNITLSDKVKKMQFRIKKLEKRNKMQGENNMSKMIQELIVSKCSLYFDDETSGDYDTLEIDDEWLKISQTDKKGRVELRIVRIDNIKELRPLG